VWFVFALARRARFCEPAAAVTTVDKASFAPILDAWNFGDAHVEPIEIGLINRTFRVDRGRERWILQCLNPLFDAKLHFDIEAITSHIESKGLLTPRLVRTRENKLWLEREGIWRVFTYLPGRVVARVESPALARTAGRLVAQFHGAVSDLEHVFHFTRPGVHDMAAHRAKLTNALRDHAKHVLYDRVAPVAERLLAVTATLPSFHAHPQRVAHGDLKITNVLFDETLREAQALLDLDTLARMPLAFEMGDAFRSWCNPGGEDQTEARFDADVFRAAVEGYGPAARAWITRDEVSVLVEATRYIALELATRFCADALNERYFGWNAARYASRGEHNLVRARGQLALAESIEDQRGALERVLAEAMP
jgi:Ser/Thr protein kinase RdoA (MazF antagonist)